MRDQHTTWTPERSRRLLELRGQVPAIPYTRMADLLSEEFGVYITANSIAGHVNRLGVTPRPNSYYPGTVRRPARRRWSIPVVREVLLRRPEPAHSRTEGCQWPISAVGEPYQFCGAERISGRPYCPEHADRAYVKTRPVVRLPHAE
jgi:hypothetical protein